MLRLVATAAAIALLPASTEAVDFNSDIRPILSDKCYLCHGPDQASREADLRLDEVDGVEYAFAEGEFDYSEAWRRITSDDAEERMPPPDSVKQLSGDEIALLKEWMTEGAGWSKHWSFEPPERPEIPDVEQSDWVANDIDAFVLRRIEQAGMAPAPPASKETLLRRVTFDLIGLPPTLQEIDAFLADESPDAYQRVVDRLLASPRYGERMAADWLDAARYSDTYGYQVDRDRFVWPWRDWLVRALNENLPYDQFITWQIAGDLLPGATTDQILATTFNRLHPQKVEGGSIPEEFRVEYVADRVHTVATAMLGLTMECCRCHDHKFDPLSQREYYSLFAFFNNIDEAGLYSYFTEAVPTPTLSLLSPEAAQRIAEAEQRVDELEQALTSATAAQRESFDVWLAGEEGERLSRSECTSKTALLQMDFEEPPAAPNEAVDGVHGKGVRLTGDDAINTEVGNFRRFQSFSIALWVNTPGEKERAVIWHRSRAYTDAASRGYQLLIEEGRLSAALIHFWPGNALCVQTKEKLPLNKWTHVAVVYDGSSRADGLQIYVDGELAETKVVRDELTKHITGGGADHLALGERFRDRGFAGGSIDELLVFDRQLSQLEAARLAGAEPLPVDASSWTPEQRAAAFDLYGLTVNDAVAKLREELRDARDNLCTLQDQRQEIMVMREMEDVRPSYLLERGAYDAHGEPVKPDTPASLPPFPPEMSRDRLGLARWLTNPTHPLTARVAVNRIWQMLLGQGLVTTAEDFGSQGAPPTHPELLDYLAVEFIESGWDVKGLQKRIVMSSTYRQSSAVSPETLAKQPNNKLLVHANRYRWPAEMMRDNALAVSGLLADRIGGPPARPYEVEASFKPVDRDEGEGLYRRSLYTYWKRTAPAPAMMTLDAAKRDVCRLRRERTNSPLQAMVVLNGPQYVEASRVLSQRIMKQHGDDVEKIIATLFRTLTSQTPNEQQRRVLTSLYEQQRVYFAEDPARTEQFLSMGDAEVDRALDPVELAAVTVVAQTLLNYDGCLTRY